MRVEIYRYLNRDKEECLIELHTSSRKGKKIEDDTEIKQLVSGLAMRAMGTYSSDGIRRVVVSKEWDRVEILTDSKKPILLDTKKLMESEIGVGEAGEVTLIATDDPESKNFVHSRWLRHDFHAITRSEKFWHSMRNINVLLRRLFRLEKKQLGSYDLASQFFAKKANLKALSKANIQSSTALKVAADYMEEHGLQTDRIATLRQAARWMKQIESLRASSSGRARRAYRNIARRMQRKVRALKPGNSTLIPISTYLGEKGEKVGPVKLLEITRSEDKTYELNFIDHNENPPIEGVTVEMLNLEDFFKPLVDIQLQTSYYEEESTFKDSIYRFTLRHPRLALNIFASDSDPTQRAVTSEVLKRAQVEGTLPDSISSLKRSQLRPQQVMGLIFKPLLTENQETADFRLQGLFGGSGRVVDSFLPLLEQQEQAKMEATSLFQFFYLYEDRLEQDPVTLAALDEGVHHIANLFLKCHLEDPEAGAVLEVIQHRIQSIRQRKAQRILKLEAVENSSFQDELVLEKAGKITEFPDKFVVKQKIRKAIKHIPNFYPKVVTKKIELKNRQALDKVAAATTFIEEVDRQKNLILKLPELFKDAHTNLFNIFSRNMQRLFNVASDLGIESESFHKEAWRIAERAARIDFDPGDVSSLNNDFRSLLRSLKASIEDKHLEITKSLYPELKQPYLIAISQCAEKIKDKKGHKEHLESNLKILKVKQNDAKKEANKLQKQYDTWNTSNPSRFGFKRNPYAYARSNANTLLRELTSEVNHTKSKLKKVESELGQLIRIRIHCLEVDECCEKFNSDKTLSSALTLYIRLKSPPSGTKNFLSDEHIELENTYIDHMTALIQLDVSNANHGRQVTELIEESEKLKEQNYQTVDRVHQKIFSDLDAFANITSLSDTHEAILREKIQASLNVLTEIFNAKKPNKYIADLEELNDSVIGTFNTVSLAVKSHRDEFRKEAEPLSDQTVKDFLDHLEKAIDRCKQVDRHTDSSISLLRNQLGRIFDSFPVENLIHPEGFFGTFLRDNKQSLFKNLNTLSELIRKASNQGFHLPQGVLQQSVISGIIYTLNHDSKNRKILLGNEGFLDNNFVRFESPSQQQQAYALKELCERTRNEKNISLSTKPVTKTSFEKKASQMSPDLKSSLTSGDVTPKYWQHIPAAYISRTTKKITLAPVKYKAPQRILNDNSFIQEYCEKNLENSLNDEESVMRKRKNYNEFMYKLFASNDTHADVGLPQILGLVCELNTIDFMRVENRQGKNIFRVIQNRLLRPRHLEEIVRDDERYQHAVSAIDHAMSIAGHIGKRPYAYCKLAEIKAHLVIAKMNLHPEKIEKNSLAKLKKELIAKLENPFFEDVEIMIQTQLLTIFGLEYCAGFPHKLSNEEFECLLEAWIIYKETLPLGKRDYIEEARMEELFFGELLPQWNDCTPEKKKQILKKILIRRNEIVKEDEINWKVKGELYTAKIRNKLVQINPIDGIFTVGDTSAGESAVKLPKLVEADFPIKNIIFQPADVRGPLKKGKDEIYEFTLSIQGKPETFQVRLREDEAIYSIQKDVDGVSQWYEWSKKLGLLEYIIDEKEKSSGWRTVAQPLVDFVQEYSLKIENSRQETPKDIWKKGIWLSKLSDTKAIVLSKDAEIKMHLEFSKDEKIKHSTLKTVSGALGDIKGLHLINNSTCNLYNQLCQMTPKKNIKIWGDDNGTIMRVETNDPSMTFVRDKEKGRLMSKEIRGYWIDEDQTLPLGDFAADWKNALILKNENGSRKLIMRQSAIKTESFLTEGGFHQNLSLDIGDLLLSDQAPFIEIDIIEHPEWGYDLQSNKPQGNFYLALTMLMGGATTRAIRFLRKAERSLNYEEASLQVIKAIFDYKSDLFVQSDFSKLISKGTSLNHAVSVASEALEQTLNRQSELEPLLPGIAAAKLTTLASILNQNISEQKDLKAILPSRDEVERMIEFYTLPSSITTPYVRLEDAARLKAGELARICRYYEIDDLPVTPVESHIPEIAKENAGIWADPDPIKLTPKDSKYTKLSSVLSRTVQSRVSVKSKMSLRAGNYIIKHFYQIYIQIDRLNLNDPKLKALERKLSRYRDITSSRREGIDFLSRMIRYKIDKNIEPKGIRLRASRKILKSHIEKYKNRLRSFKALGKDIPNQPDWMTKIEYLRAKSAFNNRNASYERFNNMLNQEIDFETITQSEMNKFTRQLDRNARKFVQKDLRARKVNPDRRVDPPVRNAGNPWWGIIDETVPYWEYFIELEILTPTLIEKSKSSTQTNFINGHLSMLQNVANPPREKWRIHDNKHQDTLENFIAEKVPEEEKIDFTALYKSASENTQYYVDVVISNKRFLESPNAFQSVKDMLVRATADELGGDLKQEVKRLESVIKARADRGVEKVAPLKLNEKGTALNNKPVKLDWEAIDTLSAVRNQQKLQKSIVWEKRKEILAVANRLPEDSKACAKEQLRRIADKAITLDIETVFLLYAKGKLKELKNHNPNLRNEDIDKLTTQITEHHLEATKLQAIDRQISAFQKFSILKKKFSHLDHQDIKTYVNHMQESPEELNQFFEKLDKTDWKTGNYTAQEFADDARNCLAAYRSFHEAANSTRYYEIDMDNIDSNIQSAISYEYTLGVVFREHQVIEFNERIDTPAIVSWLGTGFGKTFMAPGLAKMMCNGTNLVCVIDTKDLIPITSKLRDKASREVYGQAAYRFDFKRDADRSYENLLEKKYRLLSCIENQDYIVTSKESLGSLTLQLLNWQRLSVENDTDRYDKQIKLTQDIIHIFRERCVGLADEIHQILDVIQALDYSEGTRKSLSDFSHYYRNTSSIFRTIFPHSNQGKKYKKRSSKIANLLKISINKQAQVNRENLINAMKLTAELLIDQSLDPDFKPKDDLHEAISELLQSEELTRDILVDYLRMKDHQEEKVIQVPEAVINASEKIKEQIGVVKEVLCSTFERVVKKISDENFGINPKDGKSVCPYDKGRAQPEKEFDDILQTICTHYVWYQINGIPGKQLYQSIEEMQGRIEVELEDYDDKRECPTYKFYQKYFGNVHADIFSITKKNVEEIGIRCRDCPEALYGFLEYEVFPTQFIYPLKLGFNSMNLVSLLKSFGGYSGTVQTRGSFSKLVGRKDDLVVDAAAAENFQRIYDHSKNQTQFAIPDVESKAMRAKAKEEGRRIPLLSTQLVEGNIKIKDFRVIIDTGGLFKEIPCLEIAKDILQQFYPKELEAVVIHNDQGNLMILKRGAADLIPFDAKSTPPELDKRFTVYRLPQTTGSDIPQASFAKALVTISEKTRWGDFEQGVGRLRENKKGQTYATLYRESLKEKIREDLKILSNNPEENAQKIKETKAFIKVDGTIDIQLLTQSAENEEIKLRRYFAVIAEMKNCIETNVLSSLLLGNWRQLFPSVKRLYFEETLKTVTSMLSIKAPVNSLEHLKGVREAYIKLIDDLLLNIKDEQAISALNRAKTELKEYELPKAEHLPEKVIASQNWGVRQSEVSKETEVSREIEKELQTVVIAEKLIGGVESIIHDNPEEQWIKWDPTNLSGFFRNSSVPCGENFRMIDANNKALFGHLEWKSKTKPIPDTLFKDVYVTPNFVQRRPSGLSLLSRGQKMAQTVTEISMVDASGERQFINLLGDVRDHAKLLRGIHSAKQIFTEDLRNKLEALPQHLKLSEINPDIFKTKRSAERDQLANFIGKGATIKQLLSFSIRIKQGGKYSRSFGSLSTTSEEDSNRALQPYVRSKILKGDLSFGPEERAVLEPLLWKLVGIDDFHKIEEKNKPILREKLHNLLALYQRAVDVRKLDNPVDVRKYYFGRFIQQTLIFVDNPNEYDRYIERKQK